MAVIAKYNGPFRGLDFSSPAILIDPAATPDCNNVILRLNHIQNRPELIALSGAPSNTNQMTGLVQYNKMDEVGSIDIVGFTSDGLYTYDLPSHPPFPSWTKRFNADAGWGNAYVDHVNALASLCFVNGGYEIYQYINGPTYVTPALNVLSTTFGALFIMELAQSLLIANTYEIAASVVTNYPYRVRWCNAGNISQWDPNTYVGAGFSDLLDVSDVITGTLTIGSVGYLLRTNGITQITPTGNGEQPFNFNHLWATEHGIGQYYYGGCAAYGSYGVIFASDNIYVFTVSTLEKIGDQVVEEIISFIQPTTRVFAMMAPFLYDKIVYLTYNLFITDLVANAPDSFMWWQYSFKDKNWTRHQDLSYDIMCYPALVTYSS